MQATKVAEYLGISPAYATTVSAGGATPVFAVGLAVALIEAGLARSVAIAHSDIRSSAGPREQVIQQMAAIAGNAEFERPFGPLLPTHYSLLADWLAASGRLTRADLAQIAVAARGWAALNPNARKQTPLTLADVLDAPPVAGMIGRYDCCLITDFAGAVVVSARRGKRSVAVAGIGGSARNDELLQLPRDPLTGAREAAERVYDDAGLSPADIDVAFLYDSFTITVALQILAYGLDRGRGLTAFLEGVGVQGGTPVNTHGGLLSASTSGIFHLIEAVRQLRGEAGARQVAAKTALVTNIGGVFGHHAAVLLQGVSGAD
jgi:acetyl-CoA acetyltransferase